MRPTYFFTCLTPDDFTREYREALQLNNVAYLFFEIFIKQTKIVHLYSKRSSFNNHSAVFAMLFIVKLSHYTT